MAYEIPTIKLTDKDEIVNLIEEYLQSGNNVADINSLLDDIAPNTHRNTAFARDIANKMKRTGKYDFRQEPLPNNTGSRYLVSPLHIPEKSWAEKHPLLDKWRTGFITFLFSLTTGIILYIVAVPKVDPSNTQQNKRLDSLNAAISIFQKQMADSLTALRNDSTLRNK